jgi:hypothetical protein
MPFDEVSARLILGGPASGTCSDSSTGVSGGISIAHPSTVMLVGVLIRSR